MSTKHQLLTILKDHPEIYDELVRLFKTNDAALTWLTRPIRALNGHPPMSLLKNNPEKISELIHRIKTGDFS